MSREKNSTLGFYCQHLVDVGGVVRGCRLTVFPGSLFCWHHRKPKHPEVEERRREELPSKIVLSRYRIEVGAWRRRFPSLTYMTNLDQIVEKPK